MIDLEWPYQDTAGTCMRMVAYFELGKGEGERDHNKDSRKISMHVQHPHSKVYLAVLSGRSKRRVQGLE